ncbi:MAG: hypothetical protein R3F30_03650 [Planctomycetota bacterium]
MGRFVHLTWLLCLPSVLLTGCLESNGRFQEPAASSCMKCHNGSKGTGYEGDGIENPHPFPGADNLACTVCHGGNDQGADKDASHVPPPPQIGDRDYQDTHARAWFNRLTLAGVDKYADYTVGSTTYTAIDWLQFVNPGDLRVTSAGRACGMCHQGHASKVQGSMLATETGILGGAMFAAGDTNKIAANQGLYQDTASDLAIRAVSDPTYSADPLDVGRVGSLIEQPVHSERNNKAADQLFENFNYVRANIELDQDAANRVIPDSRLSHLLREQFAFTCGDCHLGSAGANNRAGDFRSSGCTACHMPYSLDGRSRSQDPNVPKDEPLDPDDIDDPERSHVRAHRIVSVHKTLPGGQRIEGMDDLTCAGCHQGSNRTVMQYWGIRLDQNQDVRRNRQYPANPQTWRGTRDDERLFPPEVGNRTFNGRNFNQYLSFEDYDGDGKDDTPADVHHEAGMGCIDCHGSYDLHGGDVGATAGNIRSRMEQGVAIKCESCHGSATAYAQVQTGLAWDGQQRELAVDRKGNLLRHVYKATDGHYYLVSKLDGVTHWVPQTMDTIVDNGKTHPVSGNKLYSVKASYAMGRDDNSTATGIGPQQGFLPHAGFSHMDNMSCASCHSSWTNTCMGCHLEGEYTNGNFFSNINGKQIVYRERFADFVYQSPLFFQLGVDEDNKIQQFSSNTKVFYRYRDIEGNLSKTFAFSSRKSQGNAPGTLGALSHNGMLAHSIRGKVAQYDEGPRYCVACHLTTKALSDYGTAYDTFRTALATGNLAAIDFNLLKTELGRNPGNQRNSPFFVHMVAGLGSGMFLFDDLGRPVNPLDNDTERKGCNNQAPKDFFNLATARYDLDRIVNSAGGPLGASNHAMLDPTQTKDLRDGATFRLMSGPLGQTLLRKLADPVNGIVLDSWLDADGALGGNASNYVK